MLNESYKLGRSDWLLVSMTRAVIHECWASEIRVRLSLPSIALAVCIVVGWEQSDQYSRLPSTKSHNSAILCDTLCFKGRRRLSAKSATLRRRCLTVCKVQVKVILSRPTSTTSMSRSTPDGQSVRLWSTRQGDIVVPRTQILSVLRIAKFSFICANCVEWSS